MSDTLLIPSAVTVPDELALDVGSIPTGMIPLHGQPVIKHIIDSFVESDSCGDIDVIVAHHPQFAALVEWAETSDYEINTVAVETPETLSQTVGTAMRNLRDRGLLANGRLCIQFADTLVYPPCADVYSNYIAYDEVDHPIRWTTFETNDENRIQTVSEKFDEFPQKHAKTFVGQFWFSEPEQFLKSLSEVKNRGDSKQKISDFYLALLSYLSEREYRIYSPSKWIDVGHLDTYHRAKVDFLNIREFNRLEIDQQKGVICKQSDDEEILNTEIDWYEKIPPEIQPYTPEVYEYNLGSEPSAKMEYIGYPPLSDIHMYGNHGIHIWKNIFQNLFDLVDSFRECTTDNYSHEVITASNRAMYIEKTVDRLRSLQKQSGFDRYFQSETVSINGESFLSVEGILDRLTTDIESTSLLNLETPSIIHGDLCFPNILYDIRTGNIKLIDPRGEFGELTIYGDYRYDLAKLIHSIDGNYEFIINDRFSVDIDEDGLKYRIHQSEQQQERRQLFGSILNSRYPNEETDLFALESLLWLSMVPLHSNDRKRQNVMLAQGIEKYNRSFIQQ